MGFEFEELEMPHINAMDKAEQQRTDEISQTFRDSGFLAGCVDIATGPPEQGKEITTQYNYSGNGEVHKADTSPAAAWKDSLRRGFGLPGNDTRTIFNPQGVHHRQPFFGQAWTHGPAVSQEQREPQDHHYEDDERGDEDSR